MALGGSISAVVNCAGWTCAVVWVDPSSAVTTLAPSIQAGGVTR